MPVDVRDSAIMGMQNVFYGGVPAEAKVPDQAKGQTITVNGLGFWERR